jgi:hypothetical protein
MKNVHRLIKILNKNLECTKICRWTQQNENVKHKDGFIMPRATMTSNSSDKQITSNTGNCETNFLARLL